MKNRDVMRRNTLYIIHFAVLSRFLIFIKDIITASRLGVSYKMDSYILALSTIMLVTKIVGDGIVVALIPLLQEIQGKYGIYKKVEYTNNLINITILISLVLFVTGFVGAPIIMRIFGPGFGELELEKAILLFRIGLPIMALYWLKSIGGGYLQAEHAFRAGAKGGVTYELILIIYLLFFARDYQLRGLMVATILAVVSQVYLIFSTMRDRGYRYEFRIDFKDRYISKVFLFLLPIVLSVGVNQLNSSIDNAVASTLPVGSIAELNYAYEIVNLFIGLFIVAVVTVIFPILSESHYKREIEDLKEGIRHGVKTLLIYTIPVTIILMIMAEPIVKIFFERGAFGWEASFLTSQALVYYALGLPAMALIPLITRTYYSIQDMQTPAILSIVSLIANTLLNLSLAALIGNKGIALATSLATSLAVAIGFVDLNRRLKFFRNEGIKRMALRLILSSTAMVIGISIVYSLISISTENILLYNLVTVGLSSLVGISLYALVYKLVKVKLQTK
ncbi:MAG: murein biosynthesis integral membrane protein MurJ [Tissierellia bacterium]|nr:murein biosynthesis integral membrane protein MurJ [Tissierellia bacterium]